MSSNGQPPMSNAETFDCLWRHITRLEIYMHALEDQVSLLKKDLKEIQQEQKYDRQILYDVGDLAMKLEDIR